MSPRNTRASTSAFSSSLLRVTSSSAPHRGGTYGTEESFAILILLPPPGPAPGDPRLGAAAHAGGILASSSYF